MRTIRIYAAEIKIHTLLKRMLLGAFIGFLLISFLVFGVDHPDPNWPSFWRLRPLVVTPIAGAFGILAFYLIDILGVKGDWPKIFLAFLSTLLFLIALWLGTVLGLDGTMWN